MSKLGAPNSLFANSMASHRAMFETLTSTFSSVTTMWASVVTITSMNVTNLQATNLVIPTYSQDIIVANNIFATVSSLSTISFSISSGLLATATTMSAVSALFTAGTFSTFLYSPIASVSTVSSDRLVSTLTNLLSITTSMILGTNSSWSTLMATNSTFSTATAMAGTIRTITTSYVLGTASSWTTVMATNSTFSTVTSSAGNMLTLTVNAVIGTASSWSTLMATTSNLTTVNGGTASFAYHYATVSTIATLSVPNILLGNVGTFGSFFSTVSTINTLSSVRVTASSAFIGTLSVSTMLAPVGAINTTSGNIQVFNSSVSFAQTQTARRLYSSVFDNNGTYYGIMYPMYMHQNVYIENLNSVSLVGQGYTISRFTTQFNNCWFELKDILTFQNLGAPATWTLGIPTTSTLTLFLRGAMNSVPFTLTLAEFDASTAQFAYGGNSMSARMTFTTNLWTNSTRYWINWDNATTLDCILATKGLTVTSSRGVIQFRMTIEFGDLAINGGNDWG